MKRILPSDSRLRYMGRIDFADADAPAFYWPGSLVQLRFTGDALAFEIENHSYDAGNGNGLSLGVMLDGKMSQLALSPENGAVQTVSVPVSGDGMHRVQLYKRQDGSHHFRLRGVQLADGAEVSAWELPARKIEAFGDSVTAGNWIEVYENVGQLDPPDYTCVHDNAYFSFAMQTARLLNAQIHLTAQGGIALLDGTGYYEYGRVGMVTAYDKLCYQPAAGQLTEWNFSRYVPDTVIFAIGQNDERIGEENRIHTPAEKQHWLDEYCRILRDLMEKYPDARFILTLTVLMHNEYWENLLDEACALLNSPRVTRFRFTRTGKATPGHPRVQEHCEMACELTEYIMQLDKDA